MQLEQQLSRAEWRERVAGRVIGGALIIALIGMFLSGSHTFGSPDPTEKDANILSVTVGAIHTVATIIFWLGLAAYFSRFRPRIKRLQDQILEESIRELREEVKELKKLVIPMQSPR